jgi:hypothetical protein
MSRYRDTPLNLLLYVDVITGRCAVVRAMYGRRQGGSEAVSQHARGGGGREGGGVGGGRHGGGGGGAGVEGTGEE